MTKILGIESLTITKLRRTWRVQIETPLGADYVLTAFRENVSKSGEEIISKEPAGSVVRSMSAAAIDAVTLQSGKTITGQELAEAIAAHIERWEDLDAAAQSPAP